MVRSPFFSRANAFLDQAHTAAGPTHSLCSIGPGRSSSSQQVASSTARATHRLMDVNRVALHALVGRWLACVECCK